MNATRSQSTKQSLLQLCNSIKDRSEIMHLCEEGRYGPEVGFVLHLDSLDQDEDYRDLFGLPDLFRVLYPDTYLKLHLIQQHFHELKEIHDFGVNWKFPTQLISTIDGEALGGLVFEHCDRNYEKANYLQRIKYFHDLIDATEERIAAMQPDNPIKLKRFPFAFGPWMQVVQTESGDSSVLVAMGGWGCSDSGTYTEFAMAKPDPATPDVAYAFNIRARNFEGVTGTEWNAVWFASAILANWFVNNIFYRNGLTELIDMYIIEGWFKEGPLTETMEEIFARFNIECPDED